MFTFSKPRYLSKRVHPVTQKTEPSYQFDVKYLGSMKDAPLSLLLEADTALTAQHLEEGVREEQEWWLSFLQSFLTASIPYFSRPYTTQHLQRILRHLLCNYPVPSVPYHICCVPTMLELIGGQLLIHWKHEVYPARIDIPDEDEDNHALPASKFNAAEIEATGIEEWDVDAVPEEQATGILTDPAMLLERQRVKEARLRAKLAVYRAQYQMSRFQDKYGQGISESESESEEEEEDEDEDEEDDRSFS